MSFRVEAAFSKDLDSCLLVAFLCSGLKDPVGAILTMTHSIATDGGVTMA